MRSELIVAGVATAQFAVKLEPGSNIALPEILLRPKCSSYRYATIMYHTGATATDRRELIRKNVADYNKKICNEIFASDSRESVSTPSGDDASSSERRGVCPDIFKAVFPVGRDSNFTGEVDSMMMDEFAVHGDLIIANFADSYSALPIKSGLMFRVVPPCLPVWENREPVEEFGELDDNGGEGENNWSEDSVAAVTQQVDGSPQVPLDKQEWFPQSVFDSIDFQRPTWLLKTDDDMILNLPAIFYYLRAHQAVHIHKKRGVDIKREFVRKLYEESSADKALKYNSRLPLFSEVEATGEPGATPTPTAAQPLSGQPEEIKSDRHYSYMGKAQREFRTKRQVGHKNRETVWTAEDFPPYPYGSLYMMTHHMAEALAKEFTLNNTAWCNEDAQVGILTHNMRRGIQQYVLTHTHNDENQEEQPMDLEEPAAGPSAEYWASDAAREWGLTIEDLTLKAEKRIAAILRIGQIGDACSPKYHLARELDKSLVSYTRKERKHLLPSDTHLPQPHLLQPPPHTPMMRKNFEITSLADCGCNEWLAAFESFDVNRVKAALRNCPLNDYWTPNVVRSV